MPSASEDDPFIWDTTRLTQELCENESSTKSYKGLHRLDLKSLAAAFERIELDGETFLTWKDESGQDDDLFRDLGITKAPHKMAIWRAIKKLQKRSTLYHAYLADSADNDEDDDDEEEEEGEEEAAVDLKDVSPASPVSSKSGTEATTHGPVLQRNTFEPVFVLKDSHFSPGRAAHPDRLMLDAQIDQPDTLAAELQEEPLQKKRRLAPVLVSTEVKDVGRSAIPTAADAISNRIPATKEPVQARDHMSSYLGHRSLELKKLVPRNSLAQSATDTSDTPKTFSHSTLQRRLPGESLVIQKRMHRLLRTNSKSLQQLHENISPFVPGNSSEDTLSDDEVLPRFGDSDDEGYDTETLKEMMDEEAEARAVPGMLSSDEVDATLEDIIHQYKTAWMETKLPRCQHKSHRLWKQAQHDNRNRAIQKATSRAADLDLRIQKLCDEIRIQDWPNRTQLQRQARCLEASVEDREYSSWLADMLRAREPAKPQSTFAPRPRRPRPVVDISDEDAEIIRSESEMSDGSFIVNDFSEDLKPTDTIPTENAHEKDDIVMDDLGEDDKPLDILADEDIAGFEDVDGIPMEVDLPEPTKLSLPSKKVIIDLTGPDSSPPRDTPSMANTHDGLLSSRQSSRFVNKYGHALVLSPEEQNIPYSEPEKIGSIDIKSWKTYGDQYRMIICYLWNRMEQDVIGQIFKVIQTEEPDDIWSSFVVPACQAEPKEEDTSTPRAMDVNLRELRLATAKLFLQFFMTRTRQPSRLKEHVKAEIMDRQEDFARFCNFLRHDVIPHFPKGADSSGPELSEDEALTSDKDDECAEDELTHASSNKKRKKRVIQDQAAHDLRTNTAVRIEVEDARRKALARRLASSTSISKDQARLVINMSKEGADDHGLIYVSSYIAPRIKDHQIEGVRFMWDQIMANQGCLLAHTMGLGKTMQIVTLLVAIAEAGSSEDESIRSQVHKSLRRPKTLVLCPSGLVENWVEELGNWAPSDVFKKDVNCFNVNAAAIPTARENTVRTWDQRGGILIVGYDIFRILVHDEELDEILTQRPSIVVADEAHKLKNQASQLAQAASRFKTTRRLALTGSPLANNVGEFFSMIDWVAPNYLGPEKEFNAYYAEPIHTGLWTDSSPYDFRQAKKKLAALDKTVAPKTHRMTIKSLKGDLPDKKEFVLILPLHPLQQKLYDMYIDAIKDKGMHGSSKTAQTFAVINNLSLICNHPRCFQLKLMEEKGKRLNAQMPSIQDNGTETETMLDPSFVASALKVLKDTTDVDSIDFSWKVKHLKVILDECRHLGEKVLVFSQSIPTLDYLENIFRQQRRVFTKMTGSTNPNVRQNMVKEFNLSNMEIFLISTTAGGIGLNIAGASRVVIFDFKYNPVHEQQAIGRAYRIGQAKPVFVYRFVAGGTKEMIHHNKAIYKTQLSSRVVDKEKPKRFAPKNTDVVQRYEEPEQQPVDNFLGKDVVLDKLLSDPNHRRAIRSIVLTDTFEEEDPTDYDLNAEERKEVESMIQMNLVRNSNPEEYRRLENELNHLRGVEQMRALGVGIARPMAGVTTSATPGAMSGAMSGSMSGALSGTISGAVPGAMLGATPRTMPGTTQQTSVPIPATASYYYSQSRLANGLQQSGGSSTLQQTSTSTNVPASNSPLAAAQNTLDRPKDKGLNPLQTQAVHRPSAQPLLPMTSSGASPFKTLQSQATTPSRVSTPATAKQFAQPLLPMTGSGVSPFGALQSQSVTPSRVPAPPADKKTTSKDEDRFEKQISTFEERIVLAAQHKALADKETVSTNGLRGKAMALTKAIRQVQVKQSRGFLPDKHVWTVLMQEAERSPRFCIAALHGLLLPEQMAIDGVQWHIEELAKLSDEKFKERLESGKGMTTSQPNGNGNPIDAEHPIGVLPGADLGQSPAPRKSITRADDLEVLKAVAERRKQRPGKLPPWAEKAVEGGK